MNFAYSNLVSVYTTEVATLATKIPSCQYGRCNKNVALLRVETRICVLCTNRIHVQYILKLLSSYFLRLKIFFLLIYVFVCIHL